MKRDKGLSEHVYTSITRGINLCNKIKLGKYNKDYKISGIERYSYSSDHQFGVGNPFRL